MSTFGSPGGRSYVAKPIPPERGSFPLDHDAECQPIMKQYLRCLRAHRGINDDECRMLSKNYLVCRMERNLMAPDEMKNLGYAEEQKIAHAAAVAVAAPSTAEAAAQQGTSTGGSASGSK